MRKPLAIALCGLVALTLASCGLIGRSDDTTTTTAPAATVSTTTGTTIPTPAAIVQMAPSVVTDLEDIKARTIAVSDDCKDLKSDACAAIQPTIDAIVADAIALSDRIDDATDEPIPEALKITQSLGEQLYCTRVPGDLCPSDTKTKLTLLANLALTIDVWKAAS